jgi:hypothetical protein
VLNSSSHLLVGLLSLLLCHGESARDSSISLLPAGRQSTLEYLAKKTCVAFSVENQ